MECLGRESGARISWLGNDVWYWENRYMGGMRLKEMDRGWPLRSDVVAGGCGKRGEEDFPRGASDSYSYVITVGV